MIRTVRIVALLVVPLLTAGCGVRLGGAAWQMEYRADGSTLLGGVHRYVDVGSDGQASWADASWHGGPKPQLRCVRKWPVAAHLSPDERAIVERLVRRFRLGDVPSPGHSTMDVPAETITVYDWASPRHAFGHTEFDAGSARLDPGLAPVVRVLDRFRC